MGLLEAVVRDNVFIDFGSEIQYGSDQVYDSYPCRFATVGFQLMPSTLLGQTADRIRVDRGYRPMHPIDGYTDELCDQEGFYDFYIGLNDWSKTKCDTFMQFVVVNTESPDNEEMYTIELDENEQVVVYNRLDEQCRECLGKGCLDLLAESRKKMEEDEN